MNVKTNKSTSQNSISRPHYQEVTKNTETQILTQLFLEELHKALSWQKQTLAEAATEIQELLQQLEATNPAASEEEKTAFVMAAIPPTRREYFLGALQAGWKEAIQEFLAQPYLHIGIAMLERWKIAD